MIVLDEQISREALRGALDWYPGRRCPLDEVRRWEHPLPLPFLCADLAQPSSRAPLPMCPPTCGNPRPIRHSPLHRWYPGCRRRPGVHRSRRP